MPDPTRQIHGRLLVRNAAGTLVDVSEYLVNVEIHEGDVSGIGTQSGGGDNVTRTMRFTLQNEGEDRFNPRDRDSDWNTVAGAYSPLLWPNREVFFAYDITEPGETPSWVHLFDGLLGDSIVADGPQVRVECRDMSKTLQDRLIAIPREYGEELGRRADLVIQDILDDEFGTGVIDVIVEDIPDFFILPYLVEYRTVWDAIQEIVNQFGWFLGQRFYAPDGVYRLTLLDPPRDKVTVDHTISAEDHYFTRTLEMSDRDIRNEVHVIFRDVTTGERAEVIVDDSDSIAEFGLRPMIIEEGGSRLITDSASATALAEYAIHDLSQPRSDFLVELAFAPQVEVFSTFSIDDPKITSTVDFFGAESVRHTLDFNRGRFRTSVVATERIVGGHLRWLREDSRPGAKKPIETGELIPGAIDTDRLRDEAVVGVKLEDGSIIAGKLAPNAVATDNLQDEAVVAVKLADGSVITVKIADEAVATGKIEDGAVVTVKLDDGSVVTGKIADFAVATDKIADEAVVTIKIDDEAVTTGKILDAAVVTDKLADDSVISLKLADGSVISVKIDDEAVITDKLADDAVISVKLADGSVITGKIADEAITEAKYAPASISTPKLQEEATFGNVFLQITDPTGDATDSATFVDIFDFNISFFLAEDDSVCFFYYSMWIEILSDPADNPQWWNGQTRILIDDGLVDTEFTTVEIRGQAEPYQVNADSWIGMGAQIGMNWFDVLDSGSHTMKGQFAVPFGDEIQSFNRTMGLILFKR